MFCTWCSTCRGRICTAGSTCTGASCSVDTYHTGTFCRICSIGTGRAAAGKLCTHNCSSVERCGRSCSNHKASVGTPDRGTGRLQEACCTFCSRCTLWAGACSAHSIGRRLSQTCSEDSIGNPPVLGNRQCMGTGRSPSCRPCSSRSLPATSCRLCSTDRCCWAPELPGRHTLSRLLRPGSHSC